MSSPWEGGSRPVAESATADLVVHLIDKGRHTEARLIATGVLDLMTRYANAEASIGTPPSDMLRAVATCVACIFAGVIENATDAENYDEMASLCGTLIAELTKGSLTSPAEGR